MYSKVILSTLLVGILAASPSEALFGSFFGKPRPTASEAGSSSQASLGRAQESVSAVDSVKNQAVNIATEIASKKRAVHEIQNSHTDDIPRLPVAANESSGHVESGGLGSQISGTSASVLSAEAPHLASDADARNLLQKEIQDVGTPIGPLQSAAPEALHSETIEHGMGSEHASLHSRVREAMASLSSLYEALHKARALYMNMETSEDKVSRSEVPENKVSNGLGPDFAANHQSDVVQESVPFETSTASPGRTVVELPTVSLSPPPVGSDRAGDTTAGENSQVPDFGHVQAQTKTATWSGPNRGSSVVASSLSALAGVMFVVAAVGLMVAGFSQSHRVATSATPLYPPRGPAFV
jgi:hypothetical protein